MKNGKIRWRNIHLWLGLAAGLIFFLECFSGLCLVFEDEITDFINRDRHFVSVGENRLPLDSLVAAANMQFPNDQIAAVKTYANPSRSVELTIGQAPPNRRGGGATNEHGGPMERPKTKTAYLNPYTSEVLAVSEASKLAFFSWMLKLHQTLLLNDFGKAVLGISTFVVLVILLSGIVLWWPKTKKIRRQRLNVKWNGNWKRINHDVHIVLGFYSTLFLTIVLLTSLPWSFNWANEALYTLTGSKPLPRNEVPRDKGPNEGGEQKSIALQEVLSLAQHKFPETPSLTIRLPQRGASDYQISAVSRDALHENGFDNMQVNRYTGSISSLAWHRDTPGGWQLRRYMKPLHTGSIGGIPTKFFMFILMLVSVTFPITGVILWINRIKPKGKKSGRSQTVESV